MPSLVTRGCGGIDPASRHVTYSHPRANELTLTFTEYLLSLFFSFFYEMNSFYRTVESAQDRVGSELLLS